MWFFILLRGILGSGYWGQDIGILDIGILGSATIYGILEIWVRTDLKESGKTKEWWLTLIS